MYEYKFGKKGKPAKPGRKKGIKISVSKETMNDLRRLVDEMEDYTGIRMTYDHYIGHLILTELFYKDEIAKKKAANA